MNIRGMPGAAGAGSGAPARDWRGTLRRLLRMLAQEPGQLAAILACTGASVTLHVLGPWQLGRATDLIYTGVVHHAAIDYVQLARILAWVAALYAGSSALNW